MSLKNQNKIVCGDCLEVLPNLPRAALVWADPPDNIGVKYNGYKDKIFDGEYIDFLRRIIVSGIEHSYVFWLSFNAKWLPEFYLIGHPPDRLFIWHYTFGQNQKKDFTQSYRPIARYVGYTWATYPEYVYIPSDRQTKYKDKRANPTGKMPDDVWEFSRVCGTHKERKPWIPNQHPKALLRRIVNFSTKPGDLVIDLFAGSGNMLEVCHELGRSCIGIDISSTYCDHIKQEHPEIAEIENDKA